METRRFPIEYLLIILIPLSLYSGAKFISALTNYPWEQVSCVIKSGYIEPNPESTAAKLPHRAEIVYSCDDPSVGIHMWEDYTTEQAAQGFLNRYKTGSTVVGYKSGSEVKLIRKPLWQLAAYLIPIVFTIFVGAKLKKKELRIRKELASSAKETGERKKEQISRLSKSVKTFDQTSATPLENKFNTEEWKEMLGTDEQIRAFKPRRAQLMQFIGIFIMFAILLGLTLWASFSAYKTWKAGLQPGCGLAAAPFLAFASLRVLVGVLRQLMGLVNPRPDVKLSSASTYPGGTMDLSWRYEGKIGGAKKILFMLVGREYGIEKRTNKGRTTFSSKQEDLIKIPIYETIQVFEIRDGRTRVKIPDHVMHSFYFGFTKIEWLLRVEVKIGGWADVHEEYPIVIQPAPIS
jgi:hypothetical protein